LTFWEKALLERYKVTLAYVAFGKCQTKAGFWVFGRVGDCFQYPIQKQLGVFDEIRDFGVPMAVMTDDDARATAMDLVPRGIYGGPFTQITWTASPYSPPR
jgi:hypothetical protein